MSAVDYKSVIAGIESLTDCDHDGDCTDPEDDERKFNLVFGEETEKPDWMKWKSKCTSLRPQSWLAPYMKCVDDVRGCNAFQGMWNDIQPTDQFGFDWKFICRFPAPAPAPAQEIPDVEPTPEVVEP